MLIYLVRSMGEYNISNLLETLNGLVPQYLTSKFKLNGSNVASSSSLRDFENKL